MRYPSIHSSIAGGAGYISPLPGTLLDILDAVLVSGYQRGEAHVNPLGWSRPFERVANECTYRPSSGTQLIYKVSDNLSGVSHKVTAVEAFESMSDLNTGFGGWGSMFLGKCAGTDSLDALKFNPAWWLVGDAAGFYLIIGDHDSYGVDSSRGVPVIIQYLGDFESLQAGDAFNCMMLGHTNPNLLSSADQYCFFKSWGAFGYTSIGKLYAAASGGSLGVAAGMVMPEGGRAMGVSTYMVDPASLTVGAIVPRLTPLLFSESTGVRGKLPGLYSVSPGIEGKTGDTFLDSAGDSFMLLNVKLSTVTWEQFALKLNAW